MEPRIDDIVSKTHKNIYFFSSISRNLHMISKAKPRWSFCWHISEFGCSHHPSPSMATRDVRHVAIAARGYGYITSDQLIDSDQLRNDTLLRSYGRYQHLVFVTMISKLRYHDLTKTDTVVTKISQVISAPVYSVVVSVCFLVWHLDYTLVHSLPVGIIKPSLFITAWVKSRCKHPYRLLPSPSWIMVTHSDLGNEFPFRYRETATRTAASVCQWYPRNIPCSGYLISEHIQHETELLHSVPCKLLKHNLLLQCRTRCSVYLKGREWYVCH